MLPVVLVHGGLYEEASPQTFWMDTGVAPALAKARTGRLRSRHVSIQPASWSEEASTLAASIQKEGLGPAAVVAGSNGCSAALRSGLGPSRSWWNASCCAGRRQPGTRFWTRLPK